MPYRGVYLGAAGVAWALDLLARDGLVSRSSRGWPSWPTRFRKGFAGRRSSVELVTPALLLGRERDPARGLVDSRRRRASGRARGLHPPRTPATRRSSSSGALRGRCWPLCSCGAAPARSAGATRGSSRRTGCSASGADASGSRICTAARITGSAPRTALPATRSRCSPAVTCSAIALTRSAIASPRVLRELAVEQDGLAQWFPARTPSRAAGRCSGATGRRGWSRRWRPSPPTRRPTGCWPPAAS